MPIHFLERWMASHSIFLVYMMKLMSTYYRTNGQVSSHTTKHDYKNSERKKVSITFNYPEVVSNHFKYRHSVDDNNAKRYAPICLEHVWATKYWHNIPFSFLLAVTDVNVNLAEAFFVRHNAPMPHLEFKKLIVKDLINNKCLREEFTSVQEIRKSQQKRAKHFMWRYVRTYVRSNEFRPERSTR